jgi:hypothetical protein
MFVVYDGDGSVVGAVKAHSEAPTGVTSRNPGMMVAEAKEVGDMRTLSAIQDEDSAVKALRLYKAEVSFRLATK